MNAVKPRVRVQAMSAPSAGAAGASSTSAAPRRATARYLRGDRTGVLSMRRAITRDGRWDVRESAERAAALALDFMHNSGWIAGAADQMIVDVIGEELKLNAQPDVALFGGNEADRSAWCREVEPRWRRYAWNPAECDLAGKRTIAEILDGTMRYYLVYGETLGVLDYLTVRERRRYGIETGTKVSLIPPHRLRRTTSEFEGLQDGIFHDAIGRPTMYRFLERNGGLEQNKDIPARDVIHVMDRGENPDAFRGISIFAPILKVIAQYQQASDATLAALMLQQAFAATIKSPEPSSEAFQAIQTLADTGDAPDGWEANEWQDFLGGIQTDFYEVWAQRFGSLKEHGVAMNDPARIAHLGPGDEFQMHTAQAPGDNYQELTKDLKREMARRLGVTATGFMMDHTGATYSSVRMEYASIWPIVLRRRSRIPSPMADGIYAAWLDEEIGTGRQGFPGGYRAFVANRARASFAEWQGPAKPSADDYKQAMAQKIRLELGTSNLTAECAELGRDFEANAASIKREMAILAEGDYPIPHPFGRAQGGAGPNGAAADGNRIPANEPV